MYSTDFYPDGLTEQDIDVLIVEAFGSTDPLADTPLLDLFDGPAPHRRHRRTVRRAASGVVRSLPVRTAPGGTTDGEAA
jgi:hypothetical protein